MNIAELDISKDGKEIVVDLTAYSPTLGWKNVSFSKVEYIAPPDDGIQDFILDGTPPSGLIQLPTIQLFSFTERLQITDWFRGVRVLRSNGEVIRTVRMAVVGEAPLGSDFCSIKSVGLSGDKLILNVSYGGGCKKHDFQLSWDGSIMKSLPPQVVLELSHNANGDSCEALIDELLQFDLSPMLGDMSEYIIHVKSSSGSLIAHRPLGNSELKDFTNVEDYAPSRAASPNYNHPWG